MNETYLTHVNEHEHRVIRILRGANPDLTEEGRLNLMQELVRAYYGEESDADTGSVNRGINFGGNGQSAR